MLYEVITIGIGTGISFEGTGWLAHIIVASEHQNRGIGSSIVRNRMEDLLERQGCKAVTFSGDPMTKKGLPLIALAAAVCALSCSLVVSAKESKPPAVTVWDRITSYNVCYTKLLRTSVNTRAGVQ